MATQPPGLNFRHCSFTVQAKQKDAKGKVPRKLITDVSGSIPAGVVLAVMGPSGAGKTTLLSMLMLDRVGGQPEGFVKLYGKDFNLELYMKYCAVVTQHDCLWWSMTPRQHISLALAFYQANLSTSERELAIDSLIDEMGLTSCQHTKAGNQFVKGLSGGQKRRLSLAVALCKKPRVVFLDEPTSGLDAAAAAAIMSFLKKAAEKEKISIFCTIHSPSAAVFAGFDQVLFLTGGRAAYLGSAAELPTYLSNLGEPLPPNTNPADHMLDLINKDFSSAEKVDDIVERWKAAQPKPVHAEESELSAPLHVGTCTQTLVLLRKHFKLIFTDPILYLARIIAYPFMALFFVVIYVESRNLVQTQVEARVYLCCWLFCVPAMMGLIAVFALNQELVAVRREIKDGMYTVSSYALATSAIQIPMIFIMALTLLVPAVYPIAKWEGSKFGVVWLASGSTMLAFEYLAQLLSLFRNPLLGMLLFMSCWFPLFLFVGVLFDEDDVIWPFRAISYVTPIKYGFLSAVWAAFYDTPDYDGAEPCPATLPASACSPGGFYCPDDTSGNSCFGITGPQILDSLSLRYPSVASDEEWQLNTLYALIFGIFMKVTYTAILVWQTRQIAPLKKPTAFPDESVSASHGTGSDKKKVAPAALHPATDLKPKIDSIVKQSSFSKKTTPADFQFKNCTFTVMVKKKGEKGKVPRKLLDDLSGTVEAGSVLAIMGPSGAGKTTLLNMLMLEDTGGDPRGVVALGGNEFTLDTYKRHACVVQQTDTLWWPLSPRDHIGYAVRMYQPTFTKAEQRDLVEKLIKKTGLESCKNTKAGNVFFKGLSGGQKRRLSLAIALSKRPHVVFLDEPTSGLDAAAAANIMFYLKEVAKAESIAILCTIHQPSTAVFNGFDKVLFLTSGRPAYLGPAAQLVSFLERAGKPVAPNANPADFMLDLINKDFGHPEVADAVVATWASEKKEVTIKEPTALSNKKSTPVGTQISVLFGKQTRLLVLDPLSYLVRAVMIVFGTMFFITIYASTRKLEQEQVVSRLFFCMWLVGMPAALGVVLIYIVNTDYQVVKREVKDGMYHPLTYVIAQMSLQLPMLCILCFCALFPAVYPTANWEISQFWRVYPAYLLAFMSFEFLAEFLAVALANPLLGMLAFINVWFTAFLFCGILVNEQEVPWPVRVFVYVLPYRWNLGEIVWSAFIDSPDYEGAYECLTPNSTSSTGLAITGPLAGQPVNCPRGFYCPDDLSGVSCWGKTGQQIIDGLSSTFKAISSEDMFGRDMGLLILIAVCFKTLYLIVFLYRSSRGRAPKKP